MTITELEKLGACKEGLDHVRQYRTWQEAVDACDNLDHLEWVIDRVRDPALAEYNRALGAARAEYDRVRDPARAEYKRMLDAALAEYNRALAPALAEYNRALGDAWAEYDRMLGPALAEYNRARLVEARRIVRDM